MKHAFESRILCPQTRICLPREVKNVYGGVDAPEHLLTRDEQTCTLRFDGDTAPKVVFDLGAASTGGYPVFKVRSFHGENPVLRLAYSDWYDYILEEPYGEQGDCKRGVLKYLGVELPVLPGDPNRYNLFTITHAGEYISPLVQGQERFLMLKLDTPGCEVEIEYVYIYYTSDMTSYDGGFTYSDENLNKLWYASVWTCQLATIDNARSWDVLNGTLLLRALTKGKDAGFYKNGMDLTDYSVECDFAIAYNPQMASGFGILLRARTLDDGYAVFFNLDQTVQAYKRENGFYTLLAQGPAALTDNAWYHASVTAQDDLFTVSLDHTPVLTFRDGTYPTGSFGFCQTTEKWALARCLRVTENKKVFFKDDFISREALAQYEFTRSAPFVSDGAKRDRLPWIGDLDWAGRNIYYAFRSFDAMKESLRMFAFHQTPDGFIWGTCYPENTRKPSDYGYYESDIFSAWFVPTLADHLLFTNDRAFAAEMYPAVQKDIEYLWRFVGSDGLFNQRYATSKGLWDHALNDMGKFAYNNLIVSEAIGEAAYIAGILEKTADAEEWTRRKNKMREAIRRYLTAPEGYLVKSTDNRDFCEMANSLALSICYFSDKKDARAALDVLLDRTPGHGKITALMIRGAYQYGFDEEAYRTLLQPGYRYVVEQTDFVVYDALENPNFDFASHRMHPANWIKALQDPRGPMTTWECMTYPPLKEGKGEAWGDRSHPDTAIAHVLTGFQLGVLPQKPGFETFSFCPHVYGLTHAEGVIPSPFGDIEASWHLKNGAMTVDIRVNDEKRLACLAVQTTDAQSVCLTVNGHKRTVKQIQDTWVLA